MSALFDKVTLPLWFAMYQYTITFGISGLSKLVDPNPLIKMFPGLPTWFWNLGGLWELAIVGFYFMFESKFISISMGCMFLGGVYYSSIFLPNNEGQTMLTKSYGLITIPVSRCY